MHKGCGGKFVASYIHWDLKCAKCGILYSNVKRYKPRRARHLHRPITVVMALAVVFLGAAWYFGLTPADVEEAVLNTIDEVEEAVNDIASAAETIPDYISDAPSTDPPAEAPASPLDRTIYPEDITHDSRSDISESTVSSPEPEPQQTKTELVEELVHAITNQHREAAGLQPLDRIQVIDQIARSHSEDMAKRNYLEHDTPEGLTPTDRGNAAGYDCRKDYGLYYTVGLAENIWFWPEGDRYGAERLASEMMDSLMSSPGHRQNIMDSSYDRIGVGVAIVSGAVYATQNFC